MIIADISESVTKCVLGKEKQDLDCIKFREFTDDGEFDQLKEFYQEKKEDMKLLISTNHNGYLPIHIAAELGFFDITEFLINEMVKNDIKFDVPCKNGRTPLYLACMNGHKGESQGKERFMTISCLLKAGSNPNTEDTKSKMNCLHWSCYFADDFDSIKILMEHGANLFAFDTNNASPFFILGLASEGTEIREERKEVFNYILDFVENYLNSDTALAERNNHSIPDYVTEEVKSKKKLILTQPKNYTQNEIILQEAMYWSIMFDRQQLFEKLLDFYISPFLDLPMKDAVFIGAIKEGIKKYVEIILDLDYSALDDSHYNVKTEYLTILDVEQNNILHMAGLWDKPEIFSFLEKRFPEGMQMRNLRGYLPIEYNNFHESTNPEPCHLLVLPNANEEVCNISKTLQKKRFKVNEYISHDSKYKFLTLSLAHSDIKEYAYAYNIKALNKTTNTLIVYKRENSNECYPLTNTQKHYIISRVMKAGVNIKNYISNGIVTEDLPMHESCKNNVYDKWGSYYFMTLFKLMIVAKVKDLFPIFATASYFSEETALYFFWLSFYTSWLFYLAIPGILFTVSQISNNSLDYYFIPVCTAIYSIWITVMHQNWKKYEDTLVRSWHVDYFTQLTTREEYKIVPYFDKIRESTLTLPGIHNKSKLLFYRIFLILFGTGMVAACFFGFRIWLMMVKDSYDVVIVGVVNGFAITVLDVIYVGLSVRLTKMESPQYQYEWLESHCTKLFYFKFANSYSLLLFLAFYDMNVESLAYMLGSIFISREISAQVFDFIIPWILYRLRIRGFKKYFASNKNTSSKRVGTETGRIISEGDEEKIKKDLGSYNAEKNFYKFTQVDICSNFSRLVIQLGYILLFSHVLPILPLVALLFNLFEIKKNLKMFLKVSRRPKAEFVYDIGIWKLYIEFFILITPILNTVSMYFTSNQYRHVVNNMFKMTRDIDVLYNAVVFEHILILVSQIMGYTVKQLPPENSASEKEAIKNRSLKEGIAPFVKAKSEYERVKKLFGRNGGPGKDTMMIEEKAVSTEVSDIKMESNEPKQVVEKIQCIKFMELVSSGKFKEIVQLYDARGKNKKLIMYKDSQRRMPIHVAANNAFPKIVKFLLHEMKQHGIPFDIPCSNYKSPLHTACCNFQNLGLDISNNKQVKDPNANDLILERDLKLLNGTKVILYLIEAGSNVNVKNESSLMNCLHWTCCNVKTDWPLIYLLRNGADFLAFDCQSMIPLDYLALQHRVDAYETLDYVLNFIENQKVDSMVAEYVKKSNVERNALHLVMESNDAEVISDIRIYSNEQLAWLSVMYWAIFRGKRELFKKLLKFNLSPFVHKYQSGNALTAAIRSRDESLVDFIFSFKYSAIDKKGEFDVVSNGVLDIDKNCNTPIHIAAMIGEDTIYKKLKTHYESARIYNSRGLSPSVLKNSIEKALDEEENQVQNFRGLRKMRSTVITSSRLDPKKERRKSKMTSREPEYIVVIRKENDGAIDLSEQFIKAKFRIRNFTSFDNKYRLTTLAVPDRAYREKAEQMNLETICREWEVSDTYTANDNNMCYPFKIMQKHAMIQRLIADEVDMDNYVNFGIVVAHYPLHMKGKEVVAKTWAQFYWSMLFNLATGGKTKNLISILILSSYFGEKIGIYYAWLSFYTSWLFYLSVPGIVVTAFQIQSYTLDHYTVPIYCLLLALWVTLMNQKWARREAKIAKAWNLDEIIEANVERKEFKGMEVYDRRTKRIILTPYTNTGARVWFYTVTLSVCGFCLIGSAFIAFRIWASTSATFESKIIVGVVNSLTIITLNSFYTWLSATLTNKENHQYQSEWEDSYVVKTYALQFGNSYASLFGTAFYDYDLNNLAFQLATILTVKQFVADIMEFIIPWFLDKLSLRWFRRNYSEENDPEHDGGDIKLQHIRADPPEVIDGYSEMVIQLGYISMFSNSLPLAPLFAFLNNLLEIRGEVSLRLNIYKRNVAESSRSIGAWRHILDILATISTMVNCFSVYFLNKECFKVLSVFVNSNEPINLLYVIVVFEHALILMKWIVRNCFNKKQIPGVNKRGPIYRKMLLERGWRKAELQAKTQEQPNYSKTSVVDKEENKDREISQALSNANSHTQLEEVKEEINELILDLANKGIEEDKEVSLNHSSEIVEDDDMCIHAGNTLYISCRESEGY